MTSRPTVVTGKAGEAAAVRFLQQKKYEILERNYRWTQGEIDIVARHDDQLIFVEVKTATGASFGDPESWVDEHKQRQIGMAAEHYLIENDLDDIACRFDVIAVLSDGGRWKIRHIENAFWLE